MGGERKFAALCAKVRYADKVTVGSFEAKLCSWPIADLKTARSNCLFLVQKDDWWIGVRF